MTRNDSEDDLLLSIDEDNLEEFIIHTKDFNNWQTYLLTDEQEYLIHYAISNVLNPNT